MTKKWIAKIGALSIAFTVMAGTSALATSVGTVKGNNVNVRSEANTTSKVLLQKDTGDTVTIISKEGDWYKIQLSDGKVAYMFAKYVVESAPAKTTTVAAATTIVTPAIPAGSVSSAALSTTTKAEGATDTAAQDAELAQEIAEDQAEDAADDSTQEPVITATTKLISVTTDVLRLRSTANMENDKNIIGKLKFGDTATIIGEDGDWYKVLTSDQLTGYVYKQYVKVVDAKAPTTLNTTELRSKVVNFAKSYLGTKYRYGGLNLSTGVDCSGFVKLIMKEFGIDLNRSSASQSKNGVAVSYDQLQPGDLIFYGYSTHISHVGIYIGNGQIIHASTPRTGVIISNASKTGGKHVITCRSVLN